MIIIYGTVKKCAFLYHSFRNGERGDKVKASEDFPYVLCARKPRYNGRYYVHNSRHKKTTGAARTQTPAVKEYPNEPKTPQGSTGSSHLERERHNDMYRSDRGGNYTDSAKPASPMVTPRPSTARNRLKQAQNMDLAVQRNSPPQEDRTERR